MEIIKIGNVELLKDEAKQIYENKKYVVSYIGVYQIFYSQNAGFYGQKIIDIKGIAKRGRFHIMDSKSINPILEKKILIEEA